MRSREVPLGERYVSRVVLTNDDEGVNVRPLPILADARDGFFAVIIYHLDVRFEIFLRSSGSSPRPFGRRLLRGAGSGSEHFDLL